MKELRVSIRQLNTTLVSPLLSAIGISDLFVINSFLSLEIHPAIVFRSVSPSCKHIHIYIYRHKYISYRLILQQNSVNTTIIQLRLFIPFIHFSGSVICGNFSYYTSIPTKEIMDKYRFNDSMCVFSVYP